MFQNTFQAELARRIGSTVEIATDDALFTGILSVSGNLVLVIETPSQYNAISTRVWIPITAINFVRFLNTTTAAV